MSSEITSDLEKLGIVDAEFVERIQSDSYSDVVLKPPSTRNFVASGASRSLQHAKRCAIGEYLENTAATSENITYVYASQTALDSGVVDPAEFVHHRVDETSYFEPYSKTKSVGWVRSNHWGESEQKYVPGFDISIDYNRSNESYTQNTSFGLGAHTSFPKALEHAILEKVEADRFCSFWYSRDEYYRIDTACIAAEDVLELVQLAKDQELDIGIILLGEKFGIYTVLCYTIAEDVPRITVGLGTSRVFRESVLKSIIESLVVRTTENILRQERDLNKPSESDFDSYLDHAHWHAVDDSSRGWLLDREVRTIQPNQKHETDRHRSLRGIGNEYDVYISDLTTPIARRAGYHIVSVSIPEMIEPPINPAERPTRTHGLSQKRLKEANPHPLA